MQSFFSSSEYFTYTYVDMSENVCLDMLLRQNIQAYDKYDNKIDFYHALNRLFYNVVSSRSIENQKWRGMSGWQNNS